MSSLATSFVFFWQAVSVNAAKHTAAKDFKVLRMCVLRF
jgi:hypothetical protein